MRADLIKVKLNPTEKNVKEFIQKVNKNFANDDPEN